MTYKLYDILNIPKDASIDDIKKGFKKLAVKHHPDKGGDEEKFKEIAKAYEILSDENKRKQYDQLGDEGYERMESGGGGSGYVDPHSIFEQFFGNNHPFGGASFFNHPFGNHNRTNARKKARTVQHVIQITNKDAYFGMNKIIKITINKKCFKCLDTCANCQGKGQINNMRRMGPFTQIEQHPCHVCNASGKIPLNNTSCSTCNGKGNYSEEKIVEIKIPKGVNTGHVINFDGLGEQPSNENDIPGDLKFEILVKPDPLFERDNLHLIHTINITFQESILGKIINIPHYEGNIEIDISKYGIIQPNKKYTIREKGMHTNNTKGNLIIQFDIKYPSNILSEDIKNKLSPLLSTLS